MTTGYARSQVFEEMLVRSVFYNGRRYDVVHFEDGNGGFTCTQMWRYCLPLDCPSSWYGPFPDIIVSKRRGVRV